MFSEEERKQLIELLEKRLDVTLGEIRTNFGMQCSPNAVHKLVKALGLVFIKNAQSEGEGLRGHRTRTTKMKKIPAK